MEPIPHSKLVASFYLSLYNLGAPPCMTYLTKGLLKESRFLTTDYPTGAIPRSPLPGPPSMPIVPESIGALYHRPPLQ